MAGNGCFLQVILVLWIVDIVNESATYVAHPLEEFIGIGLAPLSDV